MVALQTPGPGWALELGAHAGLMLDAIRGRYAGLIGVYLQASPVKQRTIAVSMHEGAGDDQAAAWAVVSAVAPWWPEWLGLDGVRLEVWTPGTLVTTGPLEINAVAAGRMVRTEWWWAATKQRR